VAFGHCTYRQFNSVTLSVRNASHTCHCVSFLFGGCRFVFRYRYLFLTAANAIFAVHLDSFAIFSTVNSTFAQISRCNVIKRWRWKSRDGFVPFPTPPDFDFIIPFTHSHLIWHSKPLKTVLVCAQLLFTIVLSFF
jgi:hypothetical protein